VLSNDLLVLSIAMRNTFQDLSNIKQRTSLHCDFDSVTYQRWNQGSHYFIVIVSWKIGFLSFSFRLKCLREHENVLDNDSIIKSSFTFTIIIPLHIVASKTRNA